jgi:hypothetical protein
MLSEISPVSYHQGDLLEEPAPAQGTLMQTLDALNKRFGRGAVKVSTQGAYSGWQMRQDMRNCGQSPIAMQPQTLIVGIHLARSTRGRICSPPKQRN